MSAEPNAVYRMPMRTVSPKERRAERNRPTKKEYVLSSPEFDNYLLANAANMTVRDLCFAVGRSNSYVRARCSRLGIKAKPAPRFNRGPEEAKDGFVPQPRDLDELPALPGSALRIAELARLVREGKELFRPEDRDRVNEALRAAGGARIEGPKMEAVG